MLIKVYNSKLLAIFIPIVLSLAFLMCHNVYFFHYSWLNQRDTFWNLPCSEFWTSKLTLAFSFQYVYLHLFISNTFSIYFPEIFFKDHPSGLIFMSSFTEIFRFRILLSLSWFCFAQIKRTATLYSMIKSFRKKQPLKCFRHLIFDYLNLSYILHTIRIYDITDVDMIARSECIHRTVLLQLGSQSATPEMINVSFIWAWADSFQFQTYNSCK